METSINLADLNLINKNETSIDSEMISFVDDDFLEIIKNKIELYFNKFNDDSKKINADSSQKVKDLSLYHIIDFLGPTDSQSYVDNELIKIIVYKNMRHYH